MNSVDPLKRPSGTGKLLVIYSLLVFDRSCQDAAYSLHEKVDRFGRLYDVEVDLRELGLNWDQVRALRLSTRPPWRETVADQGWPVDVTAELDAIPPDTLRQFIGRAA